MTWLKTREQFLINGFPEMSLNKAESKWWEVCDLVSRLWQRKVYWPEQAGFRNPCHGVKITFGEHWETTRRCLVMGDTLCIFKRTPCLLSGEWIGVQHAVRRFYAIVQVRDWSERTMAVRKNSAWVWDILGSHTWGLASGLIVGNEGDYQGWCPGFWLWK